MLYLSKENAKKLAEHSERECPNEACGMLAGKDGKVEKVYQMTNRDKSAKTFGDKGSGDENGRNIPFTSGNRRVSFSA